MPSIITVTPADSFSCSFSIDGAAAAVIVDLRRWRSLADLSAALAALASQSKAAVTRSRSAAPRNRSEPSVGSLGPYGAGAYAVGDEHMRMFVSRSGWASADTVAQSEKQGPAIGPVGAAIVVDADDPDNEAAASLAIAGTLAGLTGRLP